MLVIRRIVRQGPTVLLSPAAQPDHAAAARISAPPARVRAVSSAAPRATDDRLANTTSDSMISAAACALSRDAPYCRAMLLARNPRLSARPTPAHAHCGAGGAVTTPASVPSTPAVDAPAARRRRTSRGCALRPARLELAQQDVGQREAEAARQRQPVGDASRAPARARPASSTMHDAGQGQHQPHAAPSGVGRSPSRGQASTTVQAGIR